MFVETKTDGEAQQIGRDDFIAWLRTKEADTKYKFSNPRGVCAVGQYMTARGIAWDHTAYLYTVRKLCGYEPGSDFWPNQTPLSAEPQTFGALLQRMLALRAAS